MTETALRALEERIERLERFQSAEEARVLSRREMETALAAAQAKTDARDRRIINAALGVAASVIWGWSEVVAWVDRVRGWLAVGRG